MIILASQSASRKAMLESAGVPFVAVPARIDERGIEQQQAGKPPEVIALLLAEQKAFAVSCERPDSLVLGSDSLVSVDGKRFDKPRTREDAVRHLRFFSGRVMHLHSAAAFVRDGATLWTHASEAKLHVRQMSDAFIEEYLNAEWPAVSGCVGVFRIEARGVQLFERIEGDYFTVLGMPLLSVLGALRELEELPALTRPYAEVIGDPISQSKSPAIHNFWLGKLGIDAEYRACHVLPADLGDYFARRRQDSDWRGCNITMPHKQAAMPLVDRLDPLAERIGAINTVVRGDDGTLSGYNTDAPGFLEPLRPLLDQRHYFRMARVLGTGGAARAIVAALSDENFVLVLAGRDPGKAQAMLDELARGSDHHAAPLAHFAPPTDFAFDDREGCLDLVVNASPLGMAGQPPLAFDFSHAPPGSVVYDIVTNPLDTPLLQGARSAGFSTVDGLSMLIGQAAVAFEKFFGQLPPRDCDGELRAILTA